ncbi:BA75_04566T0 [Komagataella pastoris]|uniref:BA75_04566T0 n=1 Tax=Komagataella pastoris TaxID=4922 RepID=A0A1B2JJA4_PICPA|nr:BA75_04566T0 [Komagataella pastoris]
MKIKFGEEDEFKAVPQETEDIKSAVEENLAETESDSDDAPEEENISQARENVTKLELQRKQIEKEQAEKLKQKRRQLNEKFQKQQEEKRKNGKVDENVDELLPEELLESLEKTPQTAQDSKSRKAHINFGDHTEFPEDFLKPKSLKRVQKLSINKGPVTVKVLKRVSVPKSKLHDRRSEWLNRKSLDKR